MTTTRSRQRGRGSSGNRRQGPRRAVEWFDFHVNQTVSSGSQNGVQCDINLGSSEKKGATIVRTLVDLWVMPTATGTGGTGGMGLAMINSEAAAASAFPDMDSPDDQIGFLWRTFFPFFTSDANDFAQAVRFKEDLRGMRKYPAEDFELTLIMDNATGTTAFNVDGQVRFLVKKS